MTLNVVRVSSFIALCLSIAIPVTSSAQIIGVPVWSGYGANAQHTGQSPWAGGQLNYVQWHTPVDTNPTYSGGELLAHYGEPAVTDLGDVVIPVRHGSSNPFTIEGVDAVYGRPIWTATSGYIAPSYDWVPSYGPVLLPSLVKAGVVRSGGQTSLNGHSGVENGLLKPSGITIGGGTSGGVSSGVPYSTQVAWPEIGGQVAFRSNADIATGLISMHAFYGDAVFSMNSSINTSRIKICTPLTAAADGSIYFGYFIETSDGSNSVTLNTPSGTITLAGGGLGVVRPNGTGAWVSASALAGGDSGITQTQFNCAPAMSYDGSKVYIAVSAGYAGRGYLAAANTQSLVPIALVQLLDPLNSQPALVDSDSTSSPLIAPDGTVYFGVLENSLGTNNYRGWMLHYSGDLKTKYLPGQFGWDITASIVPSSWINNYPGSSSYLLACKYNNYAGAGGNGLNEVAILDPSLFQHNAKNGVKEMYEIETLLGQTPDPEYDMTDPGAVKEWCINSIAIDMTNKLAIVNSEDGTCYAWNINSNSIATKISLTAGLGEAYTSTVIGYGGNMLGYAGNVYAISNATLYAINTDMPPF